MDLKKENYFLITRKNWNIDEFKNLENEKILNLKLFFLSESFKDSHNFSVAEAFQIASIIHSLFPLVKFDYPFGHDALDIRNRDHINWNLVPDSKISNFADEKAKSKIVISIVIPFFNRSDFLKKVLAHLADQTLGKDWYEVILVDDGSHHQQVDQLKRIIENFSELQITSVYIAKASILGRLYIGNRAGPARNLGASLARGSILLFLDSDILLPANYLEQLITEHETSDITLPKRVYLTEQASDSNTIQLADLTAENVFEPPWYAYIKGFYERQNWPQEQNPWKYFITYCLSIRRETFMKAGGFRTNYISFGYEDLDLGNRILQITKRLKLINQNVYHLYHFNSGSEYTLDADRRFFQLALTSRIFFAQNLLTDAEYLIEMAQLKNLKQRVLNLFYSALWRVKGLWC